MIISLDSGGLKLAKDIFFIEGLVVVKLEIILLAASPSSEIFYFF